MSHSQLASPAPLRSALRHSRPSSPSDPAVLPHPSHSASLPVALHASSSSSGGGKLPRVYTGGSNFSPSVGYTPKVSFNTFENPNDDALFSYTLQVSSKPLLASSLITSPSPGKVRRLQANTTHPRLPLCIQPRREWLKGPRVVHRGTRLGRR